MPRDLHCAALQAEFCHRSVLGRTAPDQWACKWAALAWALNSSSPPFRPIEPAAIKLVCVSRPALTARAPLRRARPSSLAVGGDHPGPSHDGHVVFIGPLATGRPSRRESMRHGSPHAPPLSRRSSVSSVISLRDSGLPLPSLVPPSDMGDLDAGLQLMSLRRRGTAFHGAPPAPAPPGSRGAHLAAAVAFASAAGPPAVLLITGGSGAGKTALVGALIAALETTPGARGPGAALAFVPPPSPGAALRPPKPAPRITSDVAFYSFREGPFGCSVERAASGLIARFAPRPGETGYGAATATTAESVGQEGEAVCAWSAAVAAAARCDRLLIVLDGVDALDGVSGTGGDPGDDAGPSGGAGHPLAPRGMTWLLSHATLAPNMRVIVTAREGQGAESVRAMAAVTGAGLTEVAIGPLMAGETAAVVASAASAAGASVDVAAATVGALGGRGLSPAHAVALGRAAAAGGYAVSVTASVAAEAVTASMVQSWTHSWTDSGPPSEAALAAAELDSLDDGLMTFPAHGLEPRRCVVATECLVLLASSPTGLLPETLLTLLQGSVEAAAAAEGVTSPGTTHDGTADGWGDPQPTHEALDGLLTALAPHLWLPDGGSVPGSAVHRTIRLFGGARGTGGALAATALGRVGPSASKAAAGRAGRAMDGTDVTPTNQTITGLFYCYASAGMWGKLRRRVASIDTCHYVIRQLGLSEELAAAWPHLAAAGTGGRGLGMSPQGGPSTLAVAAAESYAAADEEEQEAGDAGGGYGSYAAQQALEVAEFLCWAGQGLESLPLLRRLCGDGGAAGRGDTPPEMAAAMRVALAAAEGGAA